MKKVTAIALLFIFLFNIAGYSVLYWMARRQAAAEMAVKLDKEEYSGSQTLTIKIPVTIPYQSNRDFERVVGEFEYQGQFYKLVKQRVVNDTLHVVCLLDHKEKELNNEYAKATNESSSSQSLNVVSNPLQEYFQGYALQLIPSSDGWVSSFAYNESISSPVDPIAGKNSPPPRA